MPRVKQVTCSSAYVTPNIKEIVKKAIYARAVGAAAGYFLFGETDGSVNVGNMAIPAAIGVGVGTAGGSVVGDLLSGYVIEKLDQSEGIRTAESEVIRLSVSGAGTVGVLKVMYDIDPSLSGFIAGAGSKFAGDAIHEQMDSALLGMLF